MALGAKYKEVCVCFVCVQGETTPFYTVTMEFIIILMMLQLRRVSVGWQLRGRFLLSFPFMLYIPSCSLGVCSLAGPHLFWQAGGGGGGGWELEVR